MADYYNEIEPFAAEWLRNLIKAGVLPAGEVDTRDIRDVHPADVRGFRRCHFFAGIGVWAYSIERAGWGDRPVWSGSCPCQPFSSAGAGIGFADERHLWPHWFHLIEKRRPPVVLGEQVASKDADPWVDLVHADLEALGYAFGCVPFPAAGIGAPHIRERNYWVALAEHGGCKARQQEWARPVAAVPSGAARRLGHPGSQHTWRYAGAGDCAQGEACVRSGGDVLAACQGRGLEWQDCDAANLVEEVFVGEAEPGRDGAVDPAGPLAGFWRGADWLLCRDGKWRPVESGTQPLAHGVAGRVGQLRAYGNAIVEPQAREFVMACMELMP